MKTKVWFAGPRSFENPKPVKLVMAKLVTRYGHNGLMVIQGEAPGVDTLAKKLALRNGISVVGVPALWDKRGRAAGPRRNADIAELGPDLLVALHFWDKLIDHPGTFSAVTVAHQHDIPVKLIKVPPKVAMPSSISPYAPGAKRRARTARNGAPPKSGRRRA